jgi:hypothetical protein
MGRHRARGGVRAAARLRVTSREAQDSYDEATLTADGEQTILVIEAAACRWRGSPSTGHDGRSTSKTSPPISPAVSAATAWHGGMNSSLPIRSWRPISAKYGRCREGISNANATAG